MHDANAIPQLSRFGHRRQRRGLALIMVMVFIVMISLGAYSYTQMMTAQETAVVVTGRRDQANAAVASGVEYIKNYLMMTSDQQFDAGGHYDNSNYFKDQVVGAPGEGGTRFSVISIIEDQYGEPTGIRYGLTDENSKLNVNFLASEAYETEISSEEDLSADEEESDIELEDMGSTTVLAREALMQLPNMTEIIADSILDWIDSDDVARDFGAEINEYSFLGYQPRNGPITSLDELLLVDGVTNELLYGADRNHNGVIDPHEQASTTAGSMARGWSAYLTVDSADRIEQADAEELIDINQDDLEALYDALVAAKFSEEFAAYIVIYRQSGAYKEEIPDPLPDDYQPVVPEPIGGRTPDFSQAGETKVECVLDLLGGASQASFPVEGQGQGQGQGQPEPVVCSSPYQDDADFSELLPMMNRLFSIGEELGGSSGLNLNLANSGALAGLPGIDDATVQNILQGQDREGITGDPNYNYPTWPLGVGAVTVEQMKQLKPFGSGNGAIVRAQVVGYSDVPGVFARAEVVIDASGDAPRVLLWRDLSHLGLGFSLDTLTQ